MLAERDHRARLQPLGAFRMLRAEAHFRADSEAIERAAGDAVAVEIDLVARRGQDEPAIPLGQQAGDPAVIGYRVRFDRTAAIARVIFEPAAGGVEGVADGDMRILMRMVRAAVAADGNLAAGNGEIDADLEQRALLVPRVSAFWSGNCIECLLSGIVPV